VLTLVRVE